LSTGQGICELYYRGASNYVAYALPLATAGFGRCNADDPVAPADAELATCAENPEQIDFDGLAAAGNIVFDETGMAACNSAIQELLDYTSYRELGATEAVIGPLLEQPVCQDVITGTLSEGQPCILGWECAEGLRCEANLLLSRLECLAGAALGEACVETDQRLRGCGVGLDCGDDVCVNRGGVGASCTFSDPACLEDLGCDDDLCVVPAAQGGPCTEDGGCDEGLHCDGLSSTCEDDTPVADDAVCDGQLSCATLCYSCRNDGSGTDRCINRGKAGEYCDNDQNCADAFYCSIGINSCQPLRAEGESCVSPAKCQNGLYCTSGSQVCAPIAVLGEACAMDNGNEYCEDDTYCAAGVCRDGQIDAICDDVSDCDGLDCIKNAPGDSIGLCGEYPTSGTCVGGSCAAGFYCDDADLCQMQKPAGQACLNPNECAAGYCVNDTCTPAPASCLASGESAPLIVGFFSALWVAGRIRRRRTR